jgi:colanic acid biosynthesis glycosyl transferase WcaI
MRRIWILSEHYYPEETATGHIVAYIAEGLTDEYEVRVISAQPTYHQRGSKAPAKEIHNSVLINRCWSTNLDRNVIWKRLINLVTISLSIFLSSVFRIGKGDIVLVVTNPPLLPFLTRFAAWLRRARVVLLVHDVYPEVIVASGITADDTVLVRLIRWANQKLYRSMDHIVVLGRDMKALTLLKLGTDVVDDHKVSIIPNWADLAEIEPAERTSNTLLNELGLLDKFVIQYAGNMGYVHDVETIIAAAALLRDLPDVHFLFIGSGAKQEWLEQEIERHGLENVTLIGQQPRSEQNIFLNACDVAIMALLPGMLGVSVPSRSYNILAAGKPILGVLNKESEIALMIEEEAIGWVVEPQNAAALVAIIREISQDRAAIHAIRERARTVAEGKYTAEHALQKFRNVFKAVAAD